MTKRRKTHDDPQRSHSQQDDDYIPLPIQTFLWRQTSPFVRPFLGKARDLAQIEQRDACKLFERIIITNNIWGQSPSLTDAIASIDRWRLIKVSFPFVLQCTAALLNNKLIKDHNFNRLGGNEAKMMYTLQWILMNASEECADSENEARANATNVAIAAATAASLLKPPTSSAANAIGSSSPADAAPLAAGSASSVSQATDQHQRQAQPTTGAPTTSSSTTGAVQGSSLISNNQHPSASAQQRFDSTSSCNVALSSCPASGKSIVIPAANAAANVAAVIAPSSGMSTHLHMQTTLPSSSSVSPIGSSTPTKPLTPTNPQQISNCLSSNYLLPISSIQMFVYYFAPIMENLKHSDFLTSNQRLEIGAALWEPLFNHQLPNIQCLVAQVKKPQNLVDHQQSSSVFFPTSFDVVQKRSAAPETRIGQFDFPQLPSDRRCSSAILQDQAQFGDVFVGGGLSPSSATALGTSIATNKLTAIPNEASKFKRTDLIEHHQQLHHQQLHHSRKNATTNYSSLASNQTEPDQAPINQATYATYLDIAVLRCLFISDWQESGVYWAITYLSNRLSDLHYLDEQVGNLSTQCLRLKSKSLSHIDYVAVKNINLFNTEQIDTKLAQYKKSNTSRQLYDKNNEVKSGEMNEQSHSMSLEKAPNRERAPKLSKSHHQASSNVSRFLKVEDGADNSDSGGDPSTSTKSPMRRLSFSSGMQTLANQIRKTSKRVKKSSDNQQFNDSFTSESQSSINRIPSIDGKPDLFTRIRRSSSADDLSMSQLTALSSMLQKDPIQGSNKDKQSVDSYPVIKVTANTYQDDQQKKNQRKSKQKQDYQSSQLSAQQKSEHQFLMQKLYSRSLKRLDRLTRSQTVPKDLHFSSFEVSKDYSDQPESLGAVLYVDNFGRIDPIVVLKVLHSISQRDTACSLRVCDRILSLVSKLIDIGVLKDSFSFSRRTSHKEKDLTNLLPTRQHEFSLLDNSTSPHIFQTDSKQNLDLQQQFEESRKKAVLIHRILIDIVIRLFHHVGCPNHCGMESTVDQHHRTHQAKLASSNGRNSLNMGNEASSIRNLRFKLRDTLDYLSVHNRDNFISYIQGIVNERALQQVVDILHSLLGFCHRSVDYLSSNSTANNQHHSQIVQFLPTSSNSGTNLSESARIGFVGGSLSSPRSESSDINSTNHRQSSSGNRFFGTSSSTARINSKKSTEPVENIVVSHSFKLLITRMASVSKELKLQENTSLYCDIRRLIDFIRYNYCNVFRSILLSALIDCAKIVNQKQKMPDMTPPKKAYEMTRSPSDDDSLDQNGSSVIRKGKLMNDTYETSVENDREADMGTYCPTPILQHNSTSQTQDTASPILQHRTSFGSCRFYPPGHPKYNKKIASLQGLDTQEQQQQHSQSSGILSLSKAKKKLEQVFGGKPTGKNKLNSPHLGEDLTQPNSLGQTDEQAVNLANDEASRRTSIIGHHNSFGSFHETIQRAGNGIHTPLGLQLSSIEMLKRNQQMYAAVRTGMSNFSFLMESCSPGDFLDPPLLAALLDLNSPIAIRAALFLECANFVHRCNRGQWPSWMRMNVSVHRASNSGLNQGTSGSKFRKSSSIQRTARNNTQMYKAAGRAFYHWAEAVGARLEELLLLEQEGKLESAAIFEGTENDENQVIGDLGMTSQAYRAKDNAEVDFFQPCLDNSSSPFSLKMAACQLLFEVTTFLRETYRYLPPSIVHHQAASSRLGDKMASIYDVSRAVTANRRWSMALSSLGFGQLPASLNAISAGTVTQSAASNTTHLRNQTTSAAISEHPERRISFILHETNDENEHQDQQRDKSNIQHDASSTLQTSTNPLTSINTAEQDNMRKVTSGRHLSQSSASSAVVVAAATCLLRSSGVIDNQFHRRKSIKLRKGTQEKEKSDKRAKFAQDLDEEVESSSLSEVGVRRTDSLRSRRRVSGISEKSDTSDRATNGIPQLISDNVQINQAELSGDESAGNGSCEDTCANETSEEDESRLMSNMPWFKAITLINSSIDCNCTHFPSCKVNCYKLHQSMCKKLISCVQSIYQDTDDLQNYAASIFESRLANLMNLGNQQRVSSQDSKNIACGIVRAGSDCSTNLQSHHGEMEGKRKEKKSKKYAHQLESTHDEYSPKGKKYIDNANNRLQSMMSVHLDSIASGNGISGMMTDAVKALNAAKAAQKTASAHRTQEEPQIVKYLRSNVKSLLHCPMSSFLKGAVILQRDIFVDLIKFSWNLVLEDDQQLSRTAAVGFIIASIKCPAEASKILLDELECSDASRKLAAINKFYVIWDARYQCWPRLEDGAFVHFKMAPPSIEFTLPSPKIAQESKPVVDPPWMPRKTSNVEEVTIGQDQTVQKSFVTATKTRRKQQIEIVTKALKEKHDKLREDRENYHITSVPITLYAAYEPTLGNQPGSDEMDGGGTTTEDDTQQENRALLQMKTAQALFPTCLCQSAIVMINLLDDSRVTYEGSAVYEIASKVIWSCLVEDPALFLRHFFERLTRQNQSTIFQVLRRLIRFMPRLPPQAAYTLYNYLIGFIIYYIRCPVDYSQKLISDTLSVLCLVVPSVYGLFLKDLKQILRKEQCDHNLLITANVPSAKKIIVHGSDSSGIPSQFPIDETTQFYHILVDSLEFFGIDKEKQNEYFLIDVRTNHMHNLQSYVRDYYSFKRSQHPQLQLINMNPNKAFDILQKQELINQFLEFGKVSMSLSIVKSSHMAIQRVLFLHEELMKLPTFPRKALETNFSLFRGPIGHQVFSMDRIHKICWVRVIARMFELTSGFFLQLGDIHLFLNAISGIFVLHCEEATVSRLCLATFINATYQFKNIFATDGFMPIMATIVQVYSNHQNNQLLCRSIEFVCKQFYIMHRKPFLLQLFGSVASRLNTAEIIRDNQANYPLASNHLSSNGTTSTSFILNDPSRISPTAFFRLLQSMEKAFKDPLDILELVDAEKPLRAIDFCYQQDKEAIEILDIISLCVTVTAYASDSPRSTQMLIILETVVPLYMKHLQASTSKKAGQSMGKQAHKDELQKIQSISICIRTLIVNCEGLTRNFSGPLPSIDFRSSSIRRTGPGGTKSSSSQQRGTLESGMNVDNDEYSYSGTNDKGKRDQNPGHTGGKTTFAGGIYKNGKRFSSDESEITRGEFIVPRDTLLNLVAEFLSLSTGRLMESAKKYVDLHQKHSSYELLDVRSHLRLAEVANSLLKFASTDPTVMACRGLTRYMNEILPNTEWRQEAIRPALIMILKRLDKTFNRIAKKSWVKRSTDWEGAKQLLKGAYLTFIKHPYIVHLPHLKSLISCCQNIILSDGLQSTIQASSTNLFHGFSSGQGTQQQGLALSQSASVIPQHSNEKQIGNLLNVSSNYYAPGASLTPSGSGGLQTTSAPSTAYSTQNQQAPSFAAVTVAAALAERLASSSNTNVSMTSQGFNSVTIRLIAMQLLQMGDSQTLENFIGNSMNTPEKLESLMLNLIYPMCIRVCSGARESPKLRVCDIMFILNIVLNMLAPQSSSSKSCSSTSNSPKTATDTSQFILSKITTTIGSTQTGATALGIVGSSTHSATNAHPVVQHQDSLKIGFLGLKILCVCFESQLASEWIRVSRVIRDLALQQGQPSGPLWDFLDFVATYRFPVFILLLPMIKCHLAQKVKSENFPDNASHYIQCKRLIEAKLHGAAPTICRSKSFLFVSLTAELRMLKEQLIAKRRLLVEGERHTSSHTAQQSQANSGAQGSSSSNQAHPSIEGSQANDHFTAYHRLSAAIASLANQGTQAKMTTSSSGSNQLGTSAALKGACFAAQLATSAPIGQQLVDTSGQSGRELADRQESQQSSIRLSTAKSREEARKVMNTILRRTSYPHNQGLLAPEQQASTIGERKNSQPPSPSSSNRTADVESGRINQIIMDPAMLMAAFPAPRKSNAEGSGILKQLIQTIDRQNQKQQNQKQQTHQVTGLSNIKTTPDPQGHSNEPNASSKSATVTINIGHKHE